jgi:hypothetical protein
VFFSPVDVYTSRSTVAIYEKILIGLLVLGGLGAVVDSFTSAPATPAVGNVEPGGSHGFLVISVS